ncbi:exosortase F system-associated membrane protein [Pseudalgibacter alginicilyticus]|uniref:exosortase F system-associated membrane protein n=1 Tax=Pseudalgibacter alginicilyticus TaxID=1736674 RepID=UPI0009E9479E|nr:exosortase F system-associated protein [Pseudalgibacter alginicilyticus]
MTKTVRYISIFSLFGLLILIRFFENELFYDPYLVFFQNDYLYIDSPRREILKVTSYTSLRYLLNSLISLEILFLFFQDKSVVQFSTIIYSIAFILLISIYLYFVINPKQEYYYLFFNIRRFLIQPIILILLLPAFYYHKLKN